MTATTPASRAATACRERVRCVPGARATSDWFARLVGFREQGYDATRARLAVEGETLRSLANGRSFGIGRLDLASLDELRARVAAATAPRGRLSVGIAIGDVRRMHHPPAAAGALFQVASQFNLLEMVGPHVTPEDGVTRYANDPTQGPACALAAGAATIYRNYFAAVGGAPAAGPDAVATSTGQRADRQIDALADLGAALAVATGLPVSRLWTMRNGYALCDDAGLRAIGRVLQDAGTRAALAGRLRIGLHWDVEVTDVPPPGHRVTQAFCSALPLAYATGRTEGTGGSDPDLWAPFASLVLDAAYEATLLAAVLNAARGASRTVYLTRLGGGVFGNRDAWIDAAMRRALQRVVDVPLDVRVVARDAPSAAMRALVGAFA